MTFEQYCEPLSSRVPGQQLDLTANTGGQMKRIYRVCESYRGEMWRYGASGRGSRVRDLSHGPIIDQATADGALEPLLRDVTRGRCEGRL